MIVYILRLRGNHWYVGTTSNLENRLRQHRNGEGPMWTRIHRPCARNPIKTIQVDDPVRARLVEDMETLYLMTQHGEDKVRGGSFSGMSIDHDITDVLLRHALNQCILCGEEGHYSNDCPYDSE